MKKVIFILFLLIFSESSWTQNRIYLGINLAPSLSFPLINELTPYLDERFNVSYGIKGIIFFNDDLFLESGFIFNQESFEVKDIFSTRLVSSSGIIDINDDQQDFFELSTFDANEIYQAFLIPVTIDYKLLNFEESALLLSGGFEIGYLFNVKHVWDYSNGEQEIYNRKHKDIIGELNLGLGLYQPISTNYLLILSPNYSYSFYPNYGSKSFNFSTINLDIEFYFQIN